MEGGNVLGAHQAPQHRCPQATSLRQQRSPFSAECTAGKRTQCCTHTPACLRTELASRGERARLHRCSSTVRLDLEPTCIQGLLRGGPWKGGPSTGGGTHESTGKGKTGCVLQVHAIQGGAGADRTGNALIVCVPCNHRRLIVSSNGRVAGRRVSTQGRVSGERHLRDDCRHV